MFDYTSYKHRVEQLKEAGLNPALVYGMGASGGGGVTGAISAPQVSQAAAPNIAAFRANQTANMGLALQLMKMQSEIKVNESVVKQNEANAEMIKNVETPKRIAETANIEEHTNLLAQQTQSETIKREGMAIDNDFNRIKTEIASETENADIARIKTLATESYYSLQKVIGEAQSAKAKGTVDESTIQTTIAQYNANLENTIADTMVAKAKERLTKEEALKAIHSNYNCTIQCKLRKHNRGYNGRKSKRTTNERRSIKSNSRN